MHKIQSDFPLYSHNLPPSLVCNKNSDDCWNNKCDECKGGKRFIETFPLFDTSVEVTWYQWGKKLMASGKEKLQKVQKSGKADVLYNDLTLMVPSFLEHFFIKRKQSDSYMKLKKQVETNDSTAVLEYDFQLFHFLARRSQLTGAKTKIIVFNAALWQSLGCTSVVVVSDGCSHSRDCVVVFSDNIIKQLLNENITALHIWSADPSSQFKNRYIALTLSWLQNECSIEIAWHFFASSHGKGPVDGICGAIKQLAATEVIKRKAIITDHLSFFKVVRDISAIKVFNIAAGELNQRINTSELKAIIDNAPPLPGIFSAHCLKLENGLVKMSQYSDQINVINPSFHLSSFHTNFKPQNLL